MASKIRLRRYFNSEVDLPSFSPYKVFIFNQNLYKYIINFFPPVLWACIVELSLVINTLSVISAGNALGIRII